MGLLCARAWNVASWPARVRSSRVPSVLQVRLVVQGRRALQATNESPCDESGTPGNPQKENNVARAGVAQRMKKWRLQAKKAKKTCGSNKWFVEFSRRASTCPQMSWDRHGLSCSKMHVPRPSCDELGTPGNPHKENNVARAGVAQRMKKWRLQAKKAKKSAAPKCGSWNFRDVPLRARKCRGSVARTVPLLEEARPASCCGRQVGHAR